MANHRWPMMKSANLIRVFVLWIIEIQINALIVLFRFVLSFFHFHYLYSHQCHRLSAYKQHRLRYRFI